MPDSLRDRGHAPSAVMTLNSKLPRRHEGTKPKKVVFFVSSWPYLNRFMRSLIVNSLRYYWRTNLAVVIGVATAVAVLAGALLVGDSVRGSLRDLVVGRLGKTDYVVIS